MKKPRTNYTPEEKVAAIKRHLVDKENISDICDELDLQPTVLYRWQREFFANGSAAFRTGKAVRKDPKDKRIQQLEAKIQTKNLVLSELMEAHVKLKKGLGEL